jgi:hypothetical protein
LTATHGENVEFIRFSIDIQWIFLGPSSLKGNLSKLSNANVFFWQIFEQAGAVSSKPGLAEGCRSPDASF